LNVGLFPPLPWVESILPLQMARIGQLYLVGVPAELTTMSGRRLRDTVLQTLKAAGAPDDAIVVIAGVSNSYSHYVATYEEYQIQRYEGGSTLYGPHTLAAYQQEFTKLAHAMQSGGTVPAGPDPPDLTADTFSFIPAVPVDTTPPNRSFGSVNVNVNSAYARGQQVLVSFWGGAMRNNLMSQSTFLTIEFLEVTGHWTAVGGDGDWETKLSYERTKEGYSLVTITWDIPADQPVGMYRIGHWGYAKLKSGGTEPYGGYSGYFQVQ